MFDRAVMGWRICEEKGVASPDRPNSCRFHLQNDFRYRFISPVADSFNVNAADRTHGEDRVRIQELPCAHDPMWKLI